MKYLFLMLLSVYSLHSFSQSQASSPLTFDTTVNTSGVSDEVAYRRAANWVNKDYLGFRQSAPNYDSAHRMISFTCGMDYQDRLSAGRDLASGVVLMQVKITCDAGQLRCSVAEFRHAGATANSESFWIINNADYPKALRPDEKPDPALQAVWADLQSFCLAQARKISFSVADAINKPVKAGTNGR